MHASDIFLDWIDLKQDHLKTFNMSRSPVVKLEEVQVPAGLTQEEREALYVEALKGRSFKPFDLYHGGVYARGDEVQEQREGSNVYFLLKGKTNDEKQSGFGFKRGRHTGSHSTSIGMKSDGRIVQVSGNVGRLNRADNIWNYGLADTVYLTNQVIRSKGLNIPEFTPGLQFLRDSISETDKRKGVSPWCWSGAVCNELHITSNNYAGSDALAIDIMRDMKGRRMARVAKASYGDETVNFGMPTKKGQRLHKGVVVYRKGPEMLAHAKGDEAKALIKTSSEYQMAMDMGLVRVELKLGSHYLRENNQRYLGDLDMGKLIALYSRETAGLLLARADDTIRLIDDMPQKLKLTALGWIDGRDLRSVMPDRTFRRHRKELLAYGLDVSEPRADKSSNAEETLQRMLDALPQHSLKPLPCPEWYGLPEVERRAA
ncbi:MAG: hypothetical protein RLZZ298_2984 [Pseudomonadota bacterium]|jgi:hypothetical protein